MHPRTNTRKTNIYMSLATNYEGFLGRCDFSCDCAISILCSSQAIYSAQVNKIRVLVVFVQYRQLFNIFTFPVSAQKCHMHINSTRHFFTITFMSVLNLILKSGCVNIALLHDKILIKCHNISSIGTLTCFIDTFCLLKSICVY